MLVYSLWILVFKLFGSNTTLREPKFDYPPPLTVLSPAVVPLQSKP